MGVFLITSAFPFVHHAHRLMFSLASLVDYFICALDDLQSFGHCCLAILGYCSVRYARPCGHFLFELPKAGSV